MAVKTLFIPLTWKKDVTRLAMLEAEGRLKAFQDKLNQALDDAEKDLSDHLEQGWSVLATSPIEVQEGTQIAFVLHKPDIAVQLDTQLNH